MINIYDNGDVNARVKGSRDRTAAIKNVNEMSYDRSFCMEIRTGCGLAIKWLKPEESDSFRFASIKNNTPIKRREKYETSALNNKQRRVFTRTKKNVHNSGS